MRHDKQKYSKKEYQKKTKAGKNPIKSRKKNLNQRGKIFCMARDHIEEAQKNYKTQKKAKETKCQANAKRRKSKEGP